MDADSIKRKLRDLKKLEVKLRFEEGKSDGRVLVWDTFFCTREQENGKIRYPFNLLLKMDKERFRAVLDEYFYCIYFQKYKENGITMKDAYDPDLLSILGLSAGVGFDSIKRRFRELAKQYHPDCGGDAEKMIRLLETYHKLIGESSGI